MVLLCIHMNSAIISARYRETDYPIGRFVLHRARALGLTRGELARRLGYGDLGNAHKSLGVALTTGTVPVHMRLHLAGALEIDQTMLDAVMAATARQQHDEQRARMVAQESAYAANFRPHLRTETARKVPQPIFVAALIGTARLRCVDLPAETWDVDPDERNQLVRRAIEQHYRDRGGRIAAFGAIVGYTLVIMPGYLSDYGLPFDIAGEQVGPMRVVERLPEAVLGPKIRIPD
jgi:hypothetical protein